MRQRGDLAIGFDIPKEVGVSRIDLESGIRSGSASIWINNGDFNAIQTDAF